MKPKINFQQQIIKLDSSHTLQSICLSNQQQDCFYGIDTDDTLLYIQGTAGTVQALKKLNLDQLDREKPLRMELGPGDRYLAITNDYGQYGIVYDLQQKATIIQLDRQGYYNEQTLFPLRFIKNGQQTYLIHATDWNHIDITDLSSGQVLTQRDNNQYKNELYLDYFYGQLHLSPNHKWLLSSGWIWHPFSVIKFVDLQNWLRGNKVEPEINNQLGIGILSYYWDRALCWIDDDTIAYLYHTKEDDLDEKECEEDGVAFNQGYLVVHQVSTYERKKILPCSTFPVNEYFEVEQDSVLFYQDGCFVISSKKQGTAIHDAKEGTILYQKEESYFSHYNKESKTFYSLIDPHQILFARLAITHEIS